MSYKCNVIIMKYLDHYSFIQAYLSGHMSDNEKSEFNDWLEASESNRSMYHSVSRIWQASAQNNTSLPAFNSSAAFARHMALLEKAPAEDKAAKGRVISLRAYLRVAAAVFVVAMAALFVFQWSGDSRSFTAQGTEKVALSDGSDIWMSEGTDLEFKSGGNTRKAKLTGKAYFDIQKDPSKPFVIDAGKAKVTVLGTKFIVDTRSGTVFVREGKVKVESGDGTVVLTDNQKVNFDGSSLSAVESRIFYGTEVWFNDDLVFNNSPFDKVISDIEKAYGVKIDLPSGRDWSKCTFTSGSLKNSRLDDIMTTLKLTYDLEYSKKDSHNYKISRVKCR